MGAASGRAVGVARGHALLSFATLAAAAAALPGGRDGPAPPHAGEDGRRATLALATAAAAVAAGHAGGRMVHGDARDAAGPVQKVSASGRT